ncbi:hypothetical protein GCM10022223_55870 [Kineosporia mesophila]|uniref:PIN domain-containing protein n=1 Tax=Kineosporia mesophila TaxID=566012 RepID=A0ABP7AEL2_9ACTN
MLQPVVLDTDVASRLHKGKLPGSLEARLIGRQSLLTFVTLAELTTWSRLRQWGGRSRQELADWLSGQVVLPGDEAVAVTWGHLSASAIQRGRPRPLNDMWNAACCLTHGLPLATLNVKDYQDFVDHHELRLIEGG